MPGTGRVESAHEAEHAQKLTVTADQAREVFGVRNGSGLRQIRVKPHRDRRSRADPFAEWSPFIRHETFRRISSLTVRRTPRFRFSEMPKSSAVTVQMIRGSSETPSPVGFSHSFAYVTGGHLFREEFAVETALFRIPTSRSVCATPIPPIGSVVPAGAPLRVHYETANWTIAHWHPFCGRAPAAIWVLSRRPARVQIGRRRLRFPRRGTRRRRRRSPRRRFWPG